VSDCKWYPLCECALTRLHYEDQICERLDDGLSSDAMIADLQAMFTCMSKHCPDAEDRAWAQSELKHRLFSGPISWSDAIEGALRRRGSKGVN
jgi:hypothetical protein